MLISFPCLILVGQLDEEKNRNNINIIKKIKLIIC